ncbi:MAG: hypothetical protein IJX58_03870 [Clostridia bacterium]|nr:hypothetical protein [Clostridia bacterium]
MISLKKTTALLLLAALLFSLISCGEYHQATGGGLGNNTPKPDGSVDQPALDDDPTNDFTVQLRLNEKPFSPSTAVNVYWNDGYNVHIAPVDESGFAVIDGLDGDYNVTLSSVPAGYAYDSNAYTATNDNRNIVIEMYDLNMLRGQGTSVDDVYQIASTGVYTITVNSEDDFSYIRFAPQTNGTYTVESWVSAVEDEVNPICLAYLGSAHYVYGEYKVTDVGICGSYTRNFIHTVNIADENISSSGGGSVTFTFAVGAETKSGVYPVNITFAVKRNGGFDITRGEKIDMIPEQDWSAFDFGAFNSLAGGEIVGAETLFPGTFDSYAFDDDYYKLWQVSEGGDGVYHLYDKEKYPETDGYGPVLVAYITEPCRFLDRSFTTIEDAGNNALVIQSTYNYRLFIKGFAALAAAGYYCTSDCLCHLDGSTPACLVGCTECNSGCTQVSEELMSVRGYADYANSDGVVPVTEELKLFLQRYVSNSMFFFADGEGVIETDPDYPIDAYEDSQWLFACGYYKY